MPFTHGYSRDTIHANIVHLIEEGYARGAAIAAAHREAREAFRKRFPRRELPDYIYPESGVVSARQREPFHMRHRRILSPVRENPASDLSPVDVQRGRKLYERFTGRAAEHERMIRRPELPDALTCIGEISVIQYVAERDGKAYEFRHPFRAKSRPLLCVTPDGKMVLALGGAWTFTEDGFVDD